MAMIEKIAALGIQEYGVYPAALADMIQAKKGAEAVVAALNNADVEGVLLQILEKDAAKVFEGMNIAAEAVGTEKKVLYIPAFAADLAAKVAPTAAAAGIEVVCDLVNVRACEGSLLCHIVTMAELADAVNGKQEAGVYVSVNGGELKKVPGTTTLKELVGEVKGVQTGYVIRTADALNMTVAEAGIENGVVNAITDADCVVTKVDERLQKCRAQSCGKCVFCREGLLQLEAMQKDVTVGKGRLDELDMTREIGEAMTFSTPCSMGQKSALLPLSAIDAFKGEYEEHIKKHKCAANVCKAFQKVYVDPTACTGCAKCMPACPEDAIDGAAGYIHIVFDNGCTKCGKCVDACPEKAIHLTTGRVPKLPPKMMRVGRFRK